MEQTCDIENFCSRFEVINTKRSLSQQSLFQVSYCFCQGEISDNFILCTFEFRVERGLLWILWTGSVLKEWHKQFVIRPAPSMARWSDVSHSFDSRPQKLLAFLAFAFRGKEPSHFKHEMLSVLKACGDFSLLYVWTNKGHRRLLKRNYTVSRDTYVACYKAFSVDRVPKVKISTERMNLLLVYILKSFC